MGEKTEKLDLDAAERLANAATPGPWHAGNDDCYIWGPQGEMVADQDIARARGRGASLPITDNMAFIAASRELVPALIAEVRRLEALFVFEPDEALRTHRGCAIMPIAVHNSYQTDAIKRRRLEDALRPFADVHSPDEYRRNAAAALSDQEREG